MNTGSSTLLVIGMLTAALAAVALLAMAVRELGPRGGLSGRGRLLLAAGLGTGVLAFGGKLFIIVLVPALTDATEIPFHSRADADRLLPAAYDASATTPLRYVWQALPTEAPAPPDNAPSADKIALGERLFFDQDLSRDGSVACASCHDLYDGAGTDRLSTSVGIEDRRGRRNAPTVWNAAFQAVLFWDGRAASLEEQAKGPFVNPDEMGMPTLAEVERRVAAKAGYRAAFAQVFGGENPITIDNIAAAIAAYERTLITPDTAYDRFVRGDRKALTPTQIRGMALFETVGCIGCHSGPNFSGASVFDASAPLRLFPATDTPYSRRFALLEDGGRAGADGKPGVWRIPSLRNVALTAPYFHNGSVERLEDAVRVMASAQLGRPTEPDPAAERPAHWSDADGTLRHVRRPVLSDAEVRDIVAFLESLSSDRLIRKQM
ncbi:MAG: cytochrome c peroxidase [Ectothiorhodospiraceae bacterium]|jgi:cytochrome c peroxidase|nr:cytochrome c peroxidase [Ectothiorhodospiraceae bacterium]